MVPRRQVLLLEDFLERVPSLALHAGCDPQARLEESVQSPTSLLAIELSRCRCPEDDAERAVGFEAELVRKQSGGRVVCQEPVGAELTSQRECVRFTPVQDSGFPPAARFYDGLGAELMKAKPVRPSIRPPFNPEGRLFIYGMRHRYLARELKKMKSLCLRQVEDRPGVADNSPQPDFPGTVLRERAQAMSSR